MESITQQVNKMKDLQEKILAFLDEDDDPKDHSQDVIQFIDEKQIKDEKPDLKMFLNIVSKISNNHHRSSRFFDKIFTILDNLTDSIKKHLTNIEIFNIFKKNKLILLFLLKSKILIMDTNISSIMTKSKFLRRNYLAYFFPEIEKFANINLEKAIKSGKNKLSDFDLKFYWPTDLEKELKSSENKLNEFDEKRKIGENDLFICQLIRNDSVEDFISFINQNNISLESKIRESIYETNLFLLKNKEQTLIEYATFFGSIQIFQYLLLNNVKLTPLLFFYAIHSNNPEIIHILEDQHLLRYYNLYQRFFKNSIKCYHNDFAKYYLINFLQVQNDDIPYIHNYIKYYNYSNIHIEIEDLTIYYLIKYDYFEIVKMLFQNGYININSKIISDKSLYDIFAIFFFI